MQLVLYMYNFIYSWMPCVQGDGLSVQEVVWTGVSATLFHRHCYTSCCPNCYSNQGNLWSYPEAPEDDTRMHHSTITKQTKHPILCCQGQKGIGHYISLVAWWLACKEEDKGNKPECFQSILGSTIFLKWRSKHFQHLCSLPTSPSLQASWKFSAINPKPITCDA